MNALKRAASLTGVATIILACATQALAGTVTLGDAYTGGNNTYNAPNDVIGPANVFDIVDAVVSRVGPNGDDLRVTIDTYYAGVPGTAAADGTGYGALFLTPGQNSWHPAGSASDGYSLDTYASGEWAYAFVVPQTPGFGAQAGAGQLYATTAGSVVMSNVYGNTVTAPYSGNPGYYFRADQAVQFNPTGQAVANTSGSWSVTPGIGGGPGKITFDIHDNHTLGDNFSLSWAMTCGNDVIQGLVSSVPEPSTWAMMILGFGMMGTVLRRRRVAALTAASSV